MRRLQIQRGLGVFYFLLSTSYLCSCSGVPRKTQLHYSPPSTAGIHKPLDGAKASAADAKSSVAAAVSAAEKGDLDTVKVELRAANDYIDQLTRQLLNTEEAVGYYEKKVVSQTDAANKAIDEKNHAIDVANAAVSRYHKLKFAVCLLAAAAALLLVFQFRALFIFIPPPYNLIALGVVPIAVFGFLWLRL